LTTFYIYYRLSQELVDKRNSEEESVQLSITAVVTAEFPTCTSRVQYSRLSYSLLHLLDSILIHFTAFYIYY